MKILFIGDIFGSPGRKIIREQLLKIRKEFDISFVIANAENSAQGKGITNRIYRDLLSSGVDFITLGNHSWFRKEEWSVFDQPNIIRPMNLVDSSPLSRLGKGSEVIQINGLSLRISNLLGCSVHFKEQQTNPFITFQTFLDSIPKPDIHILDFHAETTSEKNAFFWHFNGKVDAILGTHTHIPTNDYWVSSEGTAFITDVGMTGPALGVIGGEKTAIINKFLNPAQKFILGIEEGPAQLSSVLLEIDMDIKKVFSIYPILISPKPPKKNTHIIISE